MNLIIDEEAAVSPETGTANANLAYEYLIGHARWFGQPPGAALLRFLSDYCASPGR